MEQALDRSKLEQKDRAELAAIVEAMGGKAPSRAKKAELVAQILSLAGVDAGAADGQPGGGDEPAAGPEGAEADAAAGGAEGGDEGGKAAEGASADSDAGSDAGSQEAGDAAGRGAEGRDGKDRGDRDRDDKEKTGASNRGRSGGRSRREPEAAVPAGVRTPRRDAPAAWEDDVDGDAGAGGRGGPGGSAQEGAQGGDAGSGGDGEGQRGDGDEVEPGNRRRRRRGRDRHRDGQGQPDALDAEPIEVAGFLDLRDEGYGFLRVDGYLPSREDVYVSVKQVRQFGLRKGDHVTGASRPAARNEKNPALLRIDTVNGGDAEAARSRRRFEDLTPLFPDSKLRMELDDDPMNLTARIIDLVAPIGKGQRGLIVSPPKAGKTTIMKQIARSIEINNPEVELIVLLIDERPEEVTDFRRWLIRGEVVASTFDRPAEEHTHVAELTLERAKRMVEDGKDVCIILDGITRLARAYNLAAPATGRIMSGGIDAGALYPPKRFFGAARNVEEGGSLTILATALVETSSRMDEHIFEEFKGTGNMELKLDRRLAERRIFPAIDVEASSTRHEELLIPRSHLNVVWKLRRVLSGLAAESGSATPALELLLDRMRSFRTNEEFLAEVAKAPSGM